MSIFWLLFFSSVSSLAELTQAPMIEFVAAFSARPSELMETIDKRFEVATDERFEVAAEGAPLGMLLLRGLDDFSSLEPC